MSRIPHKLNAPGDFYVEDGCCTACDLPSAEAPGFFEYEVTDNEHWPGRTASHCYFCKQPQNEAEVKLVLNAMMVQEIDCIRYKGKDDTVLGLMETEGLQEYSDVQEAKLLNSDTTKPISIEPTTLVSKLLKWLS